MENLIKSINSVEISYGDNALTSIIQIEERITEIAEYLNENGEFNDFERTEFRDRLDKLVELNRDIQKELNLQVDKLKNIQEKLVDTKMVL